MSASKPPKRAPTGDYPVGYAKPPKATQFQPKQSGNPSGRPKGRPSLNEIILEEGARIAKVKVGEKVLHIDKDRAVRPVLGPPLALRWLQCRAGCGVVSLHGQPSRAHS